MLSYTGGYSLDVNFYKKTFLFQFLRLKFLNDSFKKIFKRSDRTERLNTTEKWQASRFRLIRIQRTV